jgi:hypothetical protein
MMAYRGAYDSRRRSWAWLGQEQMPTVTPPATPTPEKNGQSLGITTAALAVAGIAMAMVVMSGVFANRD